MAAMSPEYTALLLILLSGVTRSFLLIANENDQAVRGISMIS